MKRTLTLLLALSITVLGFSTELPAPDSKVTREFGVYKNHRATLTFDRPSAHVLLVTVDLDLPTTTSQTGMFASAAMSTEFAELNMLKILAVIDQDCASSKTKPLSIQRISPYKYLVTIE